MFDLEFQAQLKAADAIIFDIRNNPGGSGILGLEMAGHFMKEKTLVGYSTHKNGIVEKAIEELLKRI